MKKKKPLIDKDGEVRELTTADFKKMRPAKEVLSPKLLNMIAKRKRGQRGAQKSPTKIPVLVRYSPEVIEYFKSTGPRWQTRMDNSLKEWVKTHKHSPHTEMRCRRVKHD